MNKPAGATHVNSNGRFYKIDGVDVWHFVMDSWMPCGFEDGRMLAKKLQAI